MQVPSLIDRVRRCHWMIGARGQIEEPAIFPGHAGGELVGPLVVLPEAVLESSCGARRVDLHCLQLRPEVLVERAPLQRGGCLAPEAWNRCAAQGHLHCNYSCGAHEIEGLPKLPQKQLCLYRRVPVITSREGSALHRECLEKLTVG